jgi:hypothetical protein
MIYFKGGLYNRMSRLGKSKGCVILDLQTLRRSMKQIKERTEGVKGELGEVKL